MYKSHETGKKGEELAVEYLQRNNYSIVEHNFMCRQGEIDIIANDLQKNEIVFVEVKTRTSKLYGNPVDAVNELKQRHFKKSIEYYVYINKLEKEFIRVDVIEVYVYKKEGRQFYKINHIKQVF